MLKGRTLRDWVRRRLKDLREAQRNSGTIAQFAHAAKISPRHVYKIEAGGSSPTVETLADWLAACDTDLRRFFEPLDAGPTVRDNAQLKDMLWKLELAFDAATKNGNAELLVFAVMGSIEKALADSPRASPRPESREGEDRMDGIATRRRAKLKTGSG